MYKRIVIIPYIKGSGSGTRLRDILRQRIPVPVLIVSKHSKTYQPRWSDYVINWGCSAEWDWINNTGKSGNRIAVNKLDFFKSIEAFNKLNTNRQINIPEWTTDAKVAADWNKDYFVRTKLTGHSGDGIVACGAGEAYTKQAPLFVQYKKKRHEYRVHFFGQEVIDVTQKKRKKGFDGVDTKIRNHKNGWIYAREDITEPHDLRTQALNAAYASGLRFGAVDLIWNEKENKCYVLEINTAPGLFETTLKNYADAFIKDIEQ
jgi:hypothetical protein